MAHIGVSVDDDTKDKWETYIRESDHGSMSELIRLAVRKEIARGGEGGNVPQELERQLTQVAEIQQTLRREMGGLVDGFEDVEEAVGGQQYPQEITDLGHAIATDLEEISHRHFSDMQEEARDDARDLAHEYLDDPNRVGEIADALQYLEENLSYVESAPQGPSAYYRVRGR